MLQSEKKQTMFAKTSLNRGHLFVPWEKLGIYTNFHFSSYTVKRRSQWLYSRRMPSAITFSTTHSFIYFPADKPV